MFPFTVYELLAKNLAERADHIAVIDGRREITYRELHEQVERTAAWLIQNGVQRGDRVTIHLNRSIEEVVAIFAVARAGGVFVNLYYQWTLAQVAYVAQDCTPVVLITDTRCAREFLAHGLPPSIRRVLVKGAAPDDSRMTAWETLPEQDRAPERLIPDVDLAAILYTSGSTGQPKGVMFTHLNVVQGAQIVSRYLKLSAQDRLLGLLAFGFDYGLNQLMSACLVGGTLVLSVTMPTEIVKTLSQQRVTGFAAVPPAWIEVVRFLQANPTPLPHLRYITNSGGVIPKETLEGMTQVFPGVEINLMYGLTEAFRSTYLPPEMFLKKAGSMGKAIPNVEIFIVDPQIGVCGPGQQGELVHRGSLISRGYWNQPEATAEKIKPCPELRSRIGEEKVCYSGDLVRIDEDGYFWFVSRMDSLIKCNSIRVSPNEVEELIYQCGLVNKAVAFGVADENLGQVVHVAVNAKTGETLDEGAVMRHCRQTMPGYMIPRKIHVWEGEMPRTASGKIDRPSVINTCLDSLRPG